MSIIAVANSLDEAVQIAMARSVKPKRRLIIYRPRGSSLYYIADTETPARRFREVAVVTNGVLESRQL